MLSSKITMEPETEQELQNRKEKMIKELYETHGSNDINELADENDDLDSVDFEQ